MQPALATEPDYFTTHIKTVFDRRCIVCHACEAAPCQLKLDSYEGFYRGGYSIYPKALRLNVGDEWLFQPSRNNTNPDHLNKKLMPASIDFILNKYCRKIGIQSKITPHSARATMISSLLEHGCDLYRVSQLVNHSNVKTTQGYDKRGKKFSDSPVFGLKFF